LSRILSLEDFFCDYEIWEFFENNYINDYDSIQSIISELIGYRVIRYYINDMLILEDKSKLKIHNINITNIFTNKYNLKVIK